MKPRSLFVIVLILIVLMGCGSPQVEASKPIQDSPPPDQPAEKMGTPLKEPVSEKENSALEGDVKPEASAPSEISKPAFQEVDVSNLEGISFDDFLEKSWFTIMRRDPELLTELGLGEAFGVGNDQLTDISDAYNRETYNLFTQILKILRTYDRGSLSSDQQLNYDIYAYYLEDKLAGQDFMYYEYPITHFITGVQNQLLNFFTDIHPVTNKQDAEDYIARLSQVETKFDQVIDNMELSEQTGVITPRFILQWSMGDIRNIARSSAKTTPFYTSFSGKISALDNLTSDEKAVLLDAAEAEIETSVIPAFQNLVDYLDDLQKRAPTEDGVWQHPNGDAYYANRVQHFTTTELSPSEIHQMGLIDLERIQAEMRVIFDQLGYPSDEDLPQLFSRVERDGGTLYGEEIAAGYEAIITDAKIRAEEVLGNQPKADIIVIPGQSGGYYIGPAVDGSRPGAFYAAISGAEPRFGMASLAYHEAVPGHHTQIALALEMDLPSFRRGSHFTAYVEGWALYAEKLMAETGVYAEDAYGDLGRLQYEAFRAARLVVDTGIHVEKWTFDQAVDFMVENTGMPERNMQFEVARYIAWPGQALAYKIGMTEILRLRDNAENHLGEQFDIRGFHDTVLGNGAVPLSILEEIVNGYISTR